MNFTADYLISRLNFQTVSAGRGVSTLVGLTVPSEGLLSCGEDTGKEASDQRMSLVVDLHRGKPFLGIIHHDRELFELPPNNGQIGQGWRGRGGKAGLGRLGVRGPGSERGFWGGSCFSRTSQGCSSVRGAYSTVTGPAGRAVWISEKDSTGKPPGRSTPGLTAG